MKLFLSSLEFGHFPNEFMKLVGKNKHVALILNASDFYDDTGRQVYLARFQEDFQRLGMTSEELDLRNYFGKRFQLTDELKRFGAIWVAGGNTFVLRSAIRASGLDEILPSLLKDNQLVYGGFSAGACVVCPSLKGIEFADDPREIPKNYSPETIWEGLGLVDFHIVPHYSSQYSEVDEVVSYYEKNGINYYALRDDDVIVVDEGKLKIFKGTEFL